jgi:hypothetical protein
MPDPCDVSSSGSVGHDGNPLSSTSSLRVAAVDDRLPSEFFCKPSVRLAKVARNGARIKAVETLLREGLGRVGEAEVAEPRMPASATEVEALSWSEMKFIFAIS